MSTPAAEREPLGDALENLSCPFCGTDLRTADQALLCDRCVRSFKVIDGIPLLVRDLNYYWAEASPERMKAFLRECEQAGWRSAFARLTAEFRYITEQRHYALSQQRAGWWPLLALRPEWHVLDIGCGWGTLSYAMALRVRQVTACDVTFERLRFFQMRAAAEGLRNIRFVRAGDTPRLPFPDRQFDLVILNGVLEWTATSIQRASTLTDQPDVADAGRESRAFGPFSMSRSQIRLRTLLKAFRSPARLAREDDPEAVQGAVLREAARVLKPQGQLLLAMENRFGLDYFLGVPEDHTQIKYISLLPRWLADLYSRALTGHIYRNRTYSYWGNRRALRRAGFQSVDVLAPLSIDYRLFKRVIDPVRPETVKTFFADRKPEGRVRLWLKSLAAPLFAPSFASVGHRGLWQASFIEDLAADIAARLGAPPGRRPEWLKYRLTGSDVILATFEPAPGLGFVVKLPLNDQARRRCEVEHEALRSLHAILPDALRQRVPAALEAGEFRHIPYFAQTLLAGYPALRFLKAGRDDGWQRQALDFLVGLHSAQRTDVWLGAAEWQAEVRPQIEEGLGFVEERLGIAAARLDGYLQEQLGEQRWPLVLGHGDYWAGNLLLDKKGSRLLGVVDWDRSRPRSLPLLDLIHVLLAARVAREKQPLPELIGEAVRQGRLAKVAIETVGQGCLSGGEQPLMEAYLERLDLSRACERLRPWLLLYWLSLLTAQITGRSSDFLDDGSWSREFLEPSAACLKDLNLEKPIHAF